MFLFFLADLCPYFEVGFCPCDVNSEKLDIVFILDASGSISDEDFSSLTTALADRLEIEFPDTARVAAMVFAGLSRVIFGFEDPVYTTTEAKAQALRDLKRTDPYLGGKIMFFYLFMFHF